LAILIQFLIQLLFVGGLEILCELGHLWIVEADEQYSWVEEIIQNLELIVILINRLEVIIRCHSILSQKAVLDLFQVEIITSDIIIKTGDRIWKEIRV
jgi:hypothetical protein|tara:strand:+ start:376 stop:669 length:294 start_codon:yes stop_codon:yes gene_type:complete